MTIPHSECLVQSGVRPLVTNFLTSGHIQADRALTSYINGQTSYSFPFHEIFKGTMLGQWRYYHEDRSECLNLFDSRSGARNLLLLRLHVLEFVVTAAQREESVEVAVDALVKLFSELGASADHVLQSAAALQRHGLIRSTDADLVHFGGAVVATRSGGYYAKVLARRFPYVEACMVDTAIYDDQVWDELCEVTRAIDLPGPIVKRMEMRAARLEVYLRYLLDVERRAIDAAPQQGFLAVVKHVAETARADVARAVASARKNYGERSVAG